MTTSADLQCQAILTGLRGLETILDRPLADKVLDLGENVSTSQHKDLLIRLRKSLVQYVERAGDLVYVAMIGHFSSGKSSTINSLLNLRDSAKQRLEDLHPTDQIITLITHSKNTNSLLGVVGQGSIPIKVEDVDTELLKEIVIADTPGTGDPHLLEAMARDFLPICDLVLFFFSATSPLDTTDIPLLSELHSRLPFIPLMFVITRADELRSDPHQPVSESNFDSLKATKFLAGVMSRINRLLEPATYSIDNFILIDNKGNFRIDSLKYNLLRQVEPANLSARLAMHSHKVAFFQTTAEGLRDFFSSFLDAKLSELTRIVSGAEKNIEKYHEGVSISNNNLTKSWFDQHTSIQEIRNRATERTKSLPRLPSSVFEAEAVAKAQSEVRSDLTWRAKSVAEQLRQHAAESGLAQLKNELSRIQRALAGVDLDSLSPHDHGVLLLPLEWNFGGTEIIPAHYLAPKANNVREGIRRFLLGSGAELKRALEEIQRAIQHRTVIDKCEEIVTAAQLSLERDLEQYFQLVEVYRTGVFAMSTKESIARLGVGQQLDRLETEFTPEDKEQIQLSAKRDLFPSFAEVAAVATTELTSISEQIRSTLEDLTAIRLESAPSVEEPMEESAAKQLPSFVSELKDGLQREADDFITRMQTRLAGVIGTVLHDYDKDLSLARRARTKSYATAIIATGVLALLLYLGYKRWLSKDIGKTLLEVLLWGVAANIVGDLLGLGFAWLRDHYPKTKLKIKDQYLAVLGEKIRASIDDALQQFSVVQTPILAARLEKVYAALTAPHGDSWQASAEEQYRNLRTLSNNFEEIRRRYLEAIDSFTKECGLYFEDAQKNLGTLKSTARAIKERAIEPSFKLLERTSDELRAVKDEIIAIRFI
jgi:predicted GTPase